MRSLALALAFCFAGAASAGPFSDLVMAEGGFAEAPAGVVLRYSLAQSDQTAGGPAEVRLTVLEEDGAKFLMLSRDEAELSRFPASSANPLLLYFLENVVREMSEATGGSPFYIRNRIRDALLAADVTTEADGHGSALLEPFATDPNIARLGAFGSLRLHLVVDRAHPEILLSLKADTGAGAGGYSEEMILIGGE